MPAEPRRVDPEPGGIGPATRAALSALAADESAGLIEQARAGARARAAQILEDALVEEMLTAVAVGRTPAKAVQGDTRPTSAAEGHVWWAYCLLGADAAARSPDDLAGVEPATVVEVVCEGPVAALVSRVPLAEYEDDRLRAHLEDVAWLERTARAHEQVLEQAMQGATIVPLRLCTLYRDLDGVRTALRAHEPAVLENLSALEGCSEWGIKVFVTATSGHPERAVPAASSGTGYLAGRKAQREQANRLDELCATCVDEVHRAAAGVARQDRLNPVQRPEAHGREAEMILNGAYLVDEPSIEELRTAVATLQERWRADGFTLELTGPWPAYNFVSDAAGMIP